MTRGRLFAFPWRSRARIDQDVAREIEFHIQSRVAELAERGMTQAEALAQARSEFGDVEDARRYMTRMDRETEGMQRRREHMRDLWQDAKYALRRMRNAPVFTATAVATLALGIGANTAVFSIVEAALLRPLPYPNADRIVDANSVASWGAFAVSPPDFVDWKAQTRSFAAMAATNTYSRTLTGLGDPRSLAGASVTPEFFEVFGVAPVVGRTFRAEEVQFGNTDYAIISHALWQQSFGGRGDIVGQRIDLDGRSRTIVGVMPRTFSYPGRTAVWTPQAFSAEDLATQRGAHYLYVLALLKPGVSAEAANSDLRLVGERLAKAYPNTNKEFGAAITPLRELLVDRSSRRTLLILLAAVALVALIACANVANLTLARGTARERELAVRLALGASPRDLAYMALTESVLLALFGGAIGLLLSWALAGVLDSLRPESLRDVGDLSINLTAAGFTFLLSLVAGVLFGLAPGIQAARRANLHGALQAGGRAGISARHATRLRSVLVAAEIALAVVLLSGAGLLLKSFARLYAADIGFDARNLLVFSISLPEARYKTSAAVAPAVEQLVARVQSVPGVASAGAMSILPLSGDNYSISTHSIDGVELPKAEQPSTQIRVVTPAALATLGVRMKRGRGFEPSDRLGSPLVVLVNESAARLLFGKEDPIGHSIAIGTNFTEDTTRAGGTIVGIVSDIRDRAIARAPRPIVYFPHAQAPWSDMNVVLRARGITPMSLLRPVREQVKAIDPLLPVNDPRPMDDVVAQSVSQPRFATLLMTTFATLALILAAIGVFGVMAYVVSERTRDIGVRMALGASHRQVVTETLWHAARPLIAGVVAGFIGALWAARLMTKLLYDVQPHDPWILTSAALGLMVVALGAAYLPARRASGVDPLIALRAD